MKRIILFLGTLSVLGSISQSCSNDRDEEVVKQIEAQDFSSPNYIKSLMIGKWKGVSSSNNGNLWISLEEIYPNQVVWNTYYEFNEDGSYTFKPYTRENDESLNQNGTYTIVGATATDNAILTLTHKVGDNTFNTTIVLTGYENGIVDFYELSGLYPTGKKYYKFRKEK